MSSEKGQIDLQMTLGVISGTGSQHPAGIAAAGQYRAAGHHYSMSIASSNANYQWAVQIF